MGRYLDECDALYHLKREVRKMVNDYLSQDATFARLQKLINLANAEIKTVEKQIKANNLYYEDSTLIGFSFNRECLIMNGRYEMTLHYKRYSEDGYAHFGADSFLMVLIECGLIKD